MDLSVIGFVVAISIGIIVVGQLLLSQKNSRLEKLMPYLISVSTGVLLALCLTEFLPQSFEAHSQHTPLFMLGGIAMDLIGEKILSTTKSSMGNSCCPPVDNQECTVLSSHAACSSIGCVI